MFCMMEAEFFWTESTLRLAGLTYGIVPGPGALSKEPERGA